MLAFGIGQLIDINNACDFGVVDLGLLVVLELANRLVRGDLGLRAVGEGDGYGAVLADSDLGVVGEVGVGFLDLVLDLVLLFGGEVVRVDDAGDFGVVDLGLLVVLELANRLVRSDRGC